MTNNYTDDPDILNEDCLYRRIPLKPSHIIFDNNRDCWRPTSASFKDHPDGSPMSVTIQSELEKDNRSPEDSLDGYEDCALASVTAGQARERNQMVVKEPLPEEPAHGVVVGNEKKKGKLAKIAGWVVRPTEAELNKIELERQQKG